MKSILAFSPLDFQQVGVICPACTTEIVLHLDAPRTTLPLKCIACGNDLGDFALSHPQCNWVGFLKEAKAISLADRIRFYFSDPTNGTESTTEVHESSYSATPRNVGARPRCTGIK